MDSEYAHDLGWFILGEHLQSYEGVKNDEKFPKFTQVEVYKFPKIAMVMYYILVQINQGLFYLLVQVSLIVQVNTKLESLLDDYSGWVRITLAASFLYFLYFHTRSELITG